MNRSGGTDEGNEVEDGVFSRVAGVDGVGSLSVR